MAPCGTVFDVWPPSHIGVPGCADMPLMRHIVTDLTDVPLAPPLVERRRTPDRRKEWRGGRRDSDWVNRPLDSLARLEARRRSAGPVRRLVSTLLHLW